MRSQSQERPDSPHLRRYRWRRRDRSFVGPVGLVCALAALSCIPGPDVSGHYRVERYRDNQLTCDEIGHVGIGPSHVRLVREGGGRVLRFDRCPDGNCASEGIGAPRFLQGLPDGWKGEQRSALRLGSSCHLVERKHRLTKADHGVRVELRRWSYHDEVGSLRRHGVDDACSVETMEAMEASGELDCERYEVFDLVPTE